MKLYDCSRLELKMLIAGADVTKQIEQNTYSKNSGTINRLT